MPEKPRDLESELAALQEDMERLRNELTVEKMENPRLRAMMRSLAETVGRAAFRIEMHSGGDGHLVFTCTSSAGPEIERLQVAALAGVISALNHTWKFGDIHDLGEKDAE